MKTLADVIAYAQESPAFDAILREAAKNAVSQGVGTTEWIQLMYFFAESPGELDELSDPHGITDPQKKVDAFRTAQTFTSAACPTTVFTIEDSADAALTRSRKRNEFGSKSVAKAKQPRVPTKKTRRSAE